MQCYIIKTNYKGNYKLLSGNWICLKFFKMFHLIQMASSVLTGWLEVAGIFFSQSIVERWSFHFNVEEAIYIKNNPQVVSMTL